MKLIAMILVAPALLLLACGDEAGPVQAPDLEPCLLSSTDIQFPEVTVGQSADLGLTILNQSEQIMSLDLTIPCAEFSVVDETSLVLIPDQVGSITIRFTPTTSGPHLCEWDIGSGCSSIGLAGNATPVDSPDALMQMFHRAWMNLDDSGYGDLLDAGFVFYFAQEDVDNNAVPAESWARVDELLAIDRIFNAGGTARSVSSLSVGLYPVDSWSNQVAPEFAGTQRRSYFVNMTVNYSNGDISDVRGCQVFYVAPVETLVEGNPVATYRLRYWRDLGFSEAPRASTGALSWGALKAGP